MLISHSEMLAVHTFLIFCLMNCIIIIIIPIELGIETTTMSQIHCACAVYIAIHNNYTLRPRDIREIINPMARL